MDIIIRKAEERDLEQILQLITELALYEKAPEEVEVDLRQFKEFYNQHLFEAFVAEEEGQIHGVALYYVAYSTWKGKIIYLDDLIVTESQRCKGIGKLLFDSLINEAVNQGANQLRWHVLEWNEPAINFYKKYNSDLDPEWITGKLTKEQLEAFSSHNKD